MAMASNLRPPSAERLFLSEELDENITDPQHSETKERDGSVAPVEDNATFLSLDGHENRLKDSAGHIHAHELSPLKDHDKPDIATSVGRRHIWNIYPPSASTILSSLSKLGIPRVVHRSAYYSKDEDVPASAREYGGREFKLVSLALPYLEPFHVGLSFKESIFCDKSHPSGLRPAAKVWQFERKAPFCARNDEVTFMRGFSLGNYFQSGRYSPVSLFP